MKRLKMNQGRMIKEVNITKRTNQKAQARESLVSHLWSILTTNISTNIKKELKRIVIVGVEVGATTNHVKTNTNTVQRAAITKIKNSGRVLQAVQDLNH